MCQHGRPLLVVVALAVAHRQLGVDELLADGDLKGRGAAGRARHLDGVAEDLERLRQCDGGWPVPSPPAHASWSHVSEALAGRRLAIASA